MDCDSCYLIKANGYECAHCGGDLCSEAQRLRRGTKDIAGIHDLRHHDLSHRVVAVDQDKDGKEHAEAQDDEGEGDDDDDDEDDDDDDNDDDNDDDEDGDNSSEDESGDDTYDDVDDIILLQGLKKMLSDSKLPSTDEKLREVPRPTRLSKLVLGSPHSLTDLPPKSDLL